jgi:hypothetical protein
MDEELPQKYERHFKREYCGRFSMQGIALDSSETRFLRVRCHCWSCKRCATRRAGQYKHAIRSEAERLKLRRFLTLTLDPKKMRRPCSECAGGRECYYGDTSKRELCRTCQGLGEIACSPVPYLRSCFSKFRTYLKRKYGEAPQYIAVLEFHKNGNPHLHVLIDRFIDQRWIEATWQRIGGGLQIDIRLVDLHRVSNYLGKYLTKQMLISAPKRSRRVTASRGIKLLRKPEKKTHLWTLLKTQMEVLFQRLEAVARDVWMDEENQIEGFVVPRFSERSSV